MIQDLNLDSLCLNSSKLPSLLDTEQNFFAKVVSITPKRTIHGDFMLSVCFKDKYGRLVYGNIFEPYVQKYAENWQNFIGKIIALICIPQQRSSSTHPTLNVTGMVEMDAEKAKEIQGVLFEGIIPNLTNYKNNIENFKSNNETLNKIYSVLFKLDCYKSLTYACDMEILNACNGAYYVVFSNVLDSLRTFQFLTDVEIQRMMFALILIQSVMQTLSKKDAFAYKINVVVQVNSLMKTIGTNGDLYNTCIGYLNLCIGNTGQTTRLAYILNEVYKSVILTYKFNNEFVDIKHNNVLTINNVDIKND